MEVQAPFLATKSSPPSLIKFFNCAARKELKCHQLSRFYSSSVVNIWQCSLYSAEGHSVGGRNSCPHKKSLNLQHQMEFAGRKLHVIDDTCVIWHIHKIAKKRLLASSCLSVRKKYGSHWTDFHEI